MSENLKNYYELKQLIAQADFNIKGEALIKSALLLNWFNSLEKRFKKELIKPIKIVKNEDAIK